MPEYKKTANKKPNKKKTNKVANGFRLVVFWLIILCIGGGLFMTLSGGEGGAGRVRAEGICRTEYDVLNHGLASSEMFSKRGSGGFRFPPGPSLDSPIPLETTLLGISSGNPCQRDKLPVLLCVGIRRGVLL